MRLEVSFSATANDPDADALSYSWQIDGQPLEGQGPSLRVAFLEVGTFEVTVTVSDGTASVTDSVTISVKDEYRPEGSPDVVILGFAGRCFVSCLFVAPSGNAAYLGDTLEAIETTFKGLGLSVESHGYRAHLRDDSSHGRGYLAADEKLRFVRDTWMKDYKNPTRVVLVAHSHGNQFMSLLAFDHPEITFDYAVYLDAVCQQWDADHLGRGLGPRVNHFANYYGSQRNYPKPLNALSYACDTHPIPGLYLQDISDVVPSNVAYGLEVWSTGLFDTGLFDTPVRDDDENHRTDGSSGNGVGLGGIYQTNENHGEVYESDSAALRWVLDTINLNGLPKQGLSVQSGFVLPSAPEGFERLPYSD